MSSWTLAGAVFACAVGSPAAAQVCPPAADPCVVAMSISVDSGTIIDVGPRAFVLGAGAVLTVKTAGVLAIHAGAILLETGARIVAPGASGLGGDVTLLGMNGVTLAATSRVDVSAGAGGHVTVNAPAGNVLLGGEVRTFATTRDGDGGTITVTAAGDCDVANGAQLAASGGDRVSLGGDVDLDCGGDLQVAGAIESRGGDGGDIRFFADATVLVTPTGSLDMSGANSGSGGGLTVVGGSFVEFNGTLVSRGSTLLEIAGDGGDIDIVSTTAHVLVAGTIDLGGAPPDGDGGITTIDAATSVAMSGSFMAVAAANGTGGVVHIGAAGNVVFAGSTDLTDGFLGGELQARSGDVVSVTGTVAVDGVEIGGEMLLEGCTVAVEASGTVSNLGRAVGHLGANRLVAHEDMRIDGIVMAGVANELRYREQPPSIGPGATIVPAPVLIADPTLQCCDCMTTTSTIVPASTTTTTIGSTSTTLTTTTSPTTTLPTTTTSTPVTSTSTSTTLVTSTSVSTVVQTTTSTSTTAPTMPEQCGNCLDDDGDGRIDLADDACCAAPEPGVLQHGRIRPRSAGDAFKMIAEWAVPPPAAGDALQVQLLDGSRTTRLCAVLSAAVLHEKRQGLVFRDRQGLVADGVRALMIKMLRDGTSRLIVSGRSDNTLTSDGAVEIRHGFASSMCVSTSAVLQPGKRGYRGP